MKLNRKQEEALIQIGLNHLLNGHVRKPELTVYVPKKKKSGRRPMTPAERRVISKRMKAMWAEKRRATSK